MGVGSIVAAGLRIWAITRCCSSKSRDNNSSARSTPEPLKVDNRESNNSSQDIPEIESLGKSTRF